MRFFHCSNQKLEDYLLPTVGVSRHPGEDQRFVGKSGVWLSDDPSFSRVVEGQFQNFKYEVEINEDHPSLMEDQNMSNLMKDFENFFGPTEPLRMYFFTEQVRIVARYVWDVEKQDYIPDSSWVNP